jgi:hypothetical protein
MLPRVAGLPNTYHDWAMVSGVSNVSPGARMLFVDKTLNLSPVSLRVRASDTIFEFMKTTGTSGPSIEEVNLGSGLDSSQAGYWDNLYVKNITLGNGAGPSGNVIGAWADVAFSAGNFTAGGAQTWTLTSGDQTSFAYSVSGNSMTVGFLLDTTTVGGTPDVELRIAVPLGFTVAGRSLETTGWGLDNGSVTGIRIRASVGNAYISVFNFAGSNWAASTNATSVHGEITFAIA